MAKYVPEYRTLSIIDTFLNYKIKKVYKSVNENLNKGAPWLHFLSQQEERFFFASSVLVKKENWDTYARGWRGWGCLQG
jgi:hypothetical protein